jgi:DNA-binding XRE family transcriptional regulator
MEESFTLRELRERQEWTQDQLAKITEVDVQIIKAIEDGTPVSWQIATSITVKVKNYLGGKAIEGLNIPQNRG